MQFKLVHLAMYAAGSFVCGVQLCPLSLQGVHAVLPLCFRRGCLLKRRRIFRRRRLGCSCLFLQYWQVDPADEWRMMMLNGFLRIVNMTQSTRICIRITPDRLFPLPVQLSGVSIVLLPHCHLWRQLLPPVAQSAW